VLPLNKSLTILLTVAALSIAIPATATTCTLTTSDAVSLPGDLYLVNDVCVPDCLVSVMVYEETNGKDGLQRADRRHDDTCGGLAGSADGRVF
jgi:hypothetical protein